MIYKIGNLSVIFLQDQSPNLACFTLLFLLVLTLVLNSFLLLSVLCSDSRSNPYNASIATLSAISVIDGIFNVTSSIVFHASWTELPENAARKWCRANATILQVTGMVQSFAVAVLIYDRQIILTNFDETTKKTKILKWILVGSVVASVVTGLPVSLGVFTTSFFKERMSCSPAYVTERPATTTLAILTTTVYLIIWLFTLRVSYVVVRKVVNERRGIANSQIHVSGNQLPLYILVAILIVLFMLAVVPNIITVQLTQFYKSYDLDYYFLNQTVPSLDLRQIQTDVFDSVFAWTRHGFNVFSPGLIFFIHGEIRKQFKTTFCCFEKSLNNRPFKRNRTKIADYTIPVLFATCEGLHLRTIGKEVGINGAPSFIVKFCDLTVHESREQTAEAPFIRLNETFVVTPGKSFDETYVKLTDDFDVSNNSRNRNTGELDLIAENCSSLLSLSQRMRNRDS